MNRSGGFVIFGTGVGAVADQIDVTLNDSQVQSALQSIVSGMNQLGASASAAGQKSTASLEELGSAAAAAGTKLESAGAIGSAAGEQIAQGLGVASTGATEAAGAFERLVGTLEAVRGASGVAGEGLEALGVEAGGVAGGVGMVTEALNMLKTTAGPILIIVAALAALSAAFSFIKDGIGEAADLQSQMETLGSVVQSQGGNWKQAQEGLESYIQTTTLATGFTAGELVPALNKLVTAGNDLHDSEILESTAAEIARAKHIELAEATQLLISAEAGRAQGLVRLDTNLRSIVKSHGDLNDALKIIHKDFGDAINDSNGLEMQQARLHVVTTQLSETIGALFIPMLTGLATSMIGALKNAQDLGQGLYQMFTGFVDAAKAAGASLGHLASALNDLAHRDFGGAVAQFAQLASSGKAAYDGVTKSIGGAAKATNELVNGQDAWVRGHKEVNDAIYKYNQSMRGGLDKSHQLGNAAKGAGSEGASDATVSGTTFGPFKEDTDDVTQSQGALQRILDTNTASLDAFKSAVANASGEMERINATDAQSAQQVKILEANNTSLNTVIDEQAVRSGQLDAQRVKDIATLNASAKAHDVLQAAMLAAGGGTAQEKSKLQDLATAHEAAQKALDKTNTLIGENSSALTKNQQQLASNKTALDSITQTLNNVTVDWDTFNQKMIRDDQQHTDTLGKNHRQLALYYNSQYEVDYANFKAALSKKNAAAAAYYEGLSKMDLQHVHDEDRTMEDAGTVYDAWLKKAQVKYQEDLATWEMTNAKKVAYYKAALDEIGTVTADNIQRREELEQAYLAASIATIQDQKKAYEEAIKEETNIVDEFFTDITDSSKGFASFWKSMVDDLKSYFIKQLSQSIVQSSGFQSIMGQPGSGNGLLGSLTGLFGGHANQNQDKLKSATDEFKLSTSDFGKTIAQAHDDTLQQKDSTSTYQTSTNDYQTSTNSFQTAVNDFASAVSKMGSGGGGGGGLGSLLGGDGGGIDLSNIGSASWGDDNPFSDVGSPLGNPLFGGGPTLSNGLSLGAPLSTDLSTIGQSPLATGPAGTLPANITHVGGTALSGALGGLAIGGMVASLDGGNSTWGSIGGALGGAFGGPIGSVLGGLVGSFFGPHWGPATNFPDRSDTQNYGQFLANWQGSTGNEVNGTDFDADASHMNDGTAQQMEAWANAQAPNVATLPANEQALVQQILALEGGNPNASLGVANLHNGVWTLGDGQTISVTDAETLGANFAALGDTTANTPIFSVTRMAPDFMQSTLTPWSDNASTGAGSSGTDSTRSTLPVVNVTINGSLIGTTKEELAQLVSQQIVTNAYNGSYNIAKIAA